MEKKIRSHYYRSQTHTLILHTQCCASTVINMHFLSISVSFIPASPATEVCPKAEGTSKITLQHYQFIWHLMEWQGSSRAPLPSSQLSRILKPLWFVEAKGGNKKGINQIGCQGVTQMWSQQNTRGDTSPTTPLGWDRTRDLSLCLGERKPAKAHRMELSHPFQAQGLLEGILLFSSVFHVYFKSFRKHAGYLCCRNSALGLNYFSCRTRLSVLITRFLTT